MGPQEGIRGRPELKEVTGKDFWRMNERGTKSQIINGLFWKVMENGGSQGIQFIISILLARLLSAEEYGVINLVLIFVTIANVIVQNTSWVRLDDGGYLAFGNYDTTQDGWYFTKGKCIHITWQKTADYSPTKYFDDAGYLYHQHELEAMYARRAPVETFL